MRILHKAYVYLTCGPQLLVFRQPDQPKIGLQVPGGTLDPGESHLQGALREFHEETGLRLCGAIDHLADQDHIFNNGRGHDLHRRKHFHTRLAAIPKQEWEHFEMTPNDGGAPIRFHLFWIDLRDDAQCRQNLFYEGFDAPIPTLRKRMEII